MDPDDRVAAIADRIADGSAIDWPADSSQTDPDERAILAQLKTIAGLATLHRRPVDGTPDSSAQEGTSWGPLTITSKIGEGRFGQVYLAWDARLQRRVALKLLRAASPAASASPTHAIEEARLLARVRHPNVLAVHGAECLDGQIGIWTEFIEGRTLEDLVKQHGPIAPDEVVAIGLDLCRALSAVHEAGLLHRDIKTQNVMRETGGRIVLMDFGTGHDLEARPTKAGDLSGTPLYLAPEVLAGGEATVASDVYALAVLLFRLLTGEYPVPGRTLADVQAGHQKGGAARLSAARPKLPAPLIAAIDRGLATDPTLRHRSAIAFGRALQSVAAGARAAPGRRWAGALAGLAAATIVIVGVWATDLGGIRSYFLPGSSVRSVRLPQDTMGRPSQDGRFFPYIDAHGDVQVWERLTGGSRRVPLAKSPDEQLQSPLLSPNGDRVAYLAVRGVDRSSELRAVNVDGSWPSVLISRQTAYDAVPLQWSRDGRTILGRLLQKNNTVDLVMISATGGTPTLIRSFARDTGPQHPRLSPDGRFIAYDIRSNQGSADADVAIIAAKAGSMPQILIGGATYDDSPVWAADGKGVFFLRRDPNRSQDGWLLPVADGRAAGEPSLIVSDIGLVGELTISDAGALLYGCQNRSVDVYTSAIDLEGSGAHGAQTRVSPRSIGEHVAPSWSPDGESIAYMSTTSNGGGCAGFSKRLTIKNTSTGVERVVLPHVLSVGGYSPCWLADGQSVIVWAKYKADQWGLVRVDTRTGDSSVVAAELATDFRPSFQCGQNAEQLFYVDPRGIVARDLASGDETVPVKLGTRAAIKSFAVSPDGRRIAFVSTKRVDNKVVPFLEVQAMPGSPLELQKAEPLNNLKLQAWTPDSQSLLYTTWSGVGTEPARLFRITAGGGVPVDLHFEIVGNVVNPFSLTRDGRRVAYTERAVYSELWVRERFLDARDVHRGPR